MNPNDPTAKQPTPNPLPPPGSDSARDGAANVARSQISQIFGVNGHPNDTISHDSQPMINRQRVMTHTPTTSQPTNAPNNHIHEQHRKYHSAWQNYYKTYYERYYVSELAQQKELLAASHQPAQTEPANDSFTRKEAIDELKDDLRHKISKRAEKVRKSRHFVPTIAALVVLLLAAFVQYNGLLFAQVAAFVSPGSSTSQDIIIGTGADQEVGSDPRVIIPKISVNAPVIYGLDDLSETSSQEALQSGVIHYPISGANAVPGQKGNTVLLGHSSADFFEPGSYKFIFVQLNRLTTGDLFYLDYEGKRYTYRINKTEIINPKDIKKLAIGDDKPYATLVTCDPPGTANNRLVVYAEQIAPDPDQSSGNQSSNDSATVKGQIVGNPPTLFEQIFGGK